MALCELFRHESQCGAVAVTVSCANIHEAILVILINAVKLSIGIQIH